MEPNFEMNVNVRLARDPTLSSGDQGEERTGLLPVGPPLTYGRWLLSNLVTYIEYQSLRKYMQE